MIVFHKKGEFAGMVRIGGEQAESFWDADGFHDTETRRKVDASENAAQLGIVHDTDLEVLYREYKHDYDKRFP